MFQREPGWVMPKGDRDFSPEERADVLEPVAAAPGAPAAQVAAGEEHLGRQDLPGRHQAEHGPHASSASTTSTKSFEDRPDLRDAVTPTYPYPGKRPIFASTFYPALKEPNVELVPKAVASVTPTGIVDVDGVERRSTSS